MSSSHEPQQESYSTEADFACRREESVKAEHTRQAQGQGSPILSLPSSQTQARGATDPGQGCSSMQPPAPPSIATSPSVMVDTLALHEAATSSCQRAPSAWGYTPAHSPHGHAAGFYSLTEDGQIQDRELSTFGDGGLVADYVSDHGLAELGKATEDRRGSMEDGIDLNYPNHHTNQPYSVMAEVQQQHYQLHLHQQQQQSQQPHLADHPSFSSYTFPAYQQAGSQQSFYITPHHTAPTSPAISTAAPSQAPSRATINGSGGNSSRARSPSASATQFPGSKAANSAGKRPKSPRKRKEKHHEKMRIPKLTAPLSELTKDYVDKEVRDMEKHVHRPTEVRLAEAKAKGKIARPMNSFMLYRAAYAERTKFWCLQNNHQVVSAVSGESWPMEPASVREFYNELARIERINHQKAHPGYKFSPSKQQAAANGAAASNNKSSGKQQQQKSSASTPTADAQQHQEDDDLDGLAFGQDPTFPYAGTSTHLHSHHPHLHHPTNTTASQNTPKNKRKNSTPRRASRLSAELALPGIDDASYPPFVGALASSFATTNPGKTPPAPLGSANGLPGEYYETTVQTAAAPGVTGGVIENVTIRRTNGPGRLEGHHQQHGEVYPTHAHPQQQQQMLMDPSGMGMSVPVTVPASIPLSHSQYHYPSPTHTPQTSPLTVPSTMQTPPSIPVSMSVYPTPQPSFADEQQQFLAQQQAQCGGGGGGGMDGYTWASSGEYFDGGVNGSPVEQQGMAALELAQWVHDAGDFVNGGR